MEMSAVERSASVGLVMGAAVSFLIGVAVGKPGLGLIVGSALGLVLGPALGLIATGNNRLGLRELCRACFARAISGTELVWPFRRDSDRHSENPKRFIWTAEASDIVDKILRAFRSLNNVQSV